MGTDRRRDRAIDRQTMIASVDLRNMFEII